MVRPVRRPVRDEVRDGGKGLVEIESIGTGESIHGYSFGRKKAVSTFSCNRISGKRYSLR